MTRKQLSQIQADEHATIGGVDGKKVFVVDNAGNQITSFSSPTVAVLGLTPVLSTVTVGTTAVNLNNTGGSAVLFNSNASLRSWLGASGLASGSGILLDSEEKMCIDASNGLTAIAQANYVLLRLLELR